VTVKGGLVRRIGGKCFSYKTMIIKIYMEGEADYVSGCEPKIPD